MCIWVVKSWVWKIRNVAHQIRACSFANASMYRRFKNSRFIKNHFKISLNFCFIKWISFCMCVYSLLANNRQHFDNEQVFICFLITAQTSMKNMIQKLCICKNCLTKNGLVLSVSSLDAFIATILRSIPLNRESAAQWIIHDDDATKT